MVCKCCVYLDSQELVLPQLSCLEDPTPLSPEILSKMHGIRCFPCLVWEVFGVQLFSEEAKSPKPLLSLGKWFSTRGDFAPRIYFAMSGDVLGCRHQEGSYRHLLHRGWGCWERPCHALASPHNEELAQPKMLMVARLQTPAVDELFQPHYP